jgi:Ssp1 endopeptidase immunity protein Rap1a
MRGKAVTCAVAWLLFGWAVCSGTEAASVLGLSGKQFFRRCVEPPPDAGREAVALCASYVVGVADALQTSQRACIGPDVKGRRLLTVSLWWIREHAAYADRPAGVMIGNAIASIYPCGRATQARAGGINERQVAELERTVRFLSAAKALLVLFGL